MAGWNGAGVFVLPYSMVAEAASGVKILASHQDTQWNAVKGGLENCLTRDGQNKPSTDIDWNGKRIMNIADPSIATDAASKNYVDTHVATGGGGGTSAEWIPETHSVAWIGDYSFRVLGGDYRAFYHAGKRVKIVHNAGNTTSYGTITVALYPGTGGFTTDTVMGVRLDSGTPLVSPVMNVSYALLSYINPSYLDPRSMMLASLGGGLGPGSTTTPTLIRFTSAITDTLGEWSSWRFTAKLPGVYNAAAQLTFSYNADANPWDSILYIYKNGVEQIKYRQKVPTTGGVFSLNCGGLLPLVSGDYLEVYHSMGLANSWMGSGSGGSTAMTTFFCVNRVV